MKWNDKPFLMGENLNLNFNILRILFFLNYFYCPRCYFEPQYWGNSLKVSFHQLQSSHNPEYWAPHLWNSHTPGRTEPSGHAKSPRKSTRLAWGPLGCAEASHLWTLVSVARDAEVKPSGRNGSVFLTKRPRLTRCLRFELRRECRLPPSDCDLQRPELNHFKPDRPQEENVKSGISVNYWKNRFLKNSHDIRRTGKRCTCGIMWHNN